MKYLIVLMFFISTYAFAGSASCTATSSVSVPGNYYAADPLCIIQAQVPLNSFGLVRYYLPASPYTGQEFTLQENSDTQNDSGSYWDNELQEWVYYSYDFTGGVEFEVPNPQTYQIMFPDTSTSSAVANFTNGRYIKVIFDGETWQYSDGTF